MLDRLNLDAVRAAFARLRDARAAGNEAVIETPLVPHRTPGGARLWIKAEGLQPVGSFKIRGASHLIGRLPPGTEGVVAHSSGNHAQAVARAARGAGLRALIVMPNDAPELKRTRTAEDGAEILEVGPDSSERAERAALESERRGWPLVPPYDHPDIAAGQGTAALEALEQLGDLPLSRMYCPVSGGGLMAGCATVVSALRPDTEIVGVEPALADDTARSLAAGKRVAIAPPQTIADGLRVRVPGERTFPVLQARIGRMALVSEDQILDAMAYALRRLRLVLEPSGATALAAALAEGAEDALVIASGANADPALLTEVTARKTCAWERGV